MRTRDNAELVLELQDEMSKGLKKTQANTKKSTKAMSASVKKLGAAFVALGGVMALKSAFSGIKNINEYKDEVLNLSNATGIAVDTLSRFDYIAKINKTSSEAMTASVKKLAMTIGQAEQGSKNAERVFEDLNVTYKDSNGNLRDMESVYFDVVGALQNTENKTERLTKAQLVFGRNASELGSVLNSTKEEIQGLANEADELGITFDRAGAEKAALFNDNLTKLKETFNGIAMDLVNEVTPAMADLFEDMIPAAKLLAKYLGWVAQSYATMSKESIEQATERRLEILDERKAIEESVAKLSADVWSGDKQATKQAEELVQMYEALRIQYTNLNGSTELYNSNSAAVADMQEHLANMTSESTSELKKQNAEMKKSKDSKPEFEDFTGSSGQMPRYQTEEFQTEQNVQQESDAKIGASNEIERIKLRNQELEELNKQRSMTELELLESQYRQELELANRYSQETAEIEQYYEDQILETKEANAKQEMAIAKQKADYQIQTTQELFGTIASLQREQGALYKAFASFEVGISTSRAVMKALAQGGPLGIGAAIAMGIKGAQEIASINSSSYSMGKGPEGYGNQDTVNAMIRPDEVVLNPNQAANALWSMANGSGGGGGGNNYTINVSGNIGMNEDRLALAVVKGIDRARVTKQPRRI